MAEANTHRSYYSAERGWTDDAEGAELRLDASSLEQRLVEARNVFYRPDGKGGWQAVVKEQELAAAARGLVWETWNAAVETESLHAFRGLRVVDAAMAATLLAGLLLRDEQGLRFSEPLRAGRLFLLGKEDAVSFAKRVKAAGGTIFRSDPLPEDAGAALARMAQQLSRLEAERALDAEALTSARTGNLAGASGFEARSKGFLEACAELGEGHAELRRTVAFLRSQGRSQQEREAAELLQRQARELRDRAQMLREERDEDACELALRAGKRDSGAAPAANRILAGRALGKLAAEAGYEVEQTASGVRVRVPGGVIGLGAQFSFSAEG